MKKTVIGMLLSPFLLIGQQNSGAWRKIGPAPAAVQAIAVDPRGSGTIFMATMGAGVRKSNDNGLSWSAASTGPADLVVHTLAMDASGPQTVYEEGSGLFKTNNGGASWQNLPGISGTVAAVAADPNRTGVVYAAVFLNLASGSIQKSVDGGVTWANIFPTTAAIFNITIDPRNSDVLYAPTVGHGAFKSTDSGQSWSPMSALTPASIWTFAIDPANTQVIYAGTNQDGIWKSTDAGTTWQAAGSPLPFPVNSLIVDPSPAHTIYAGTNGGGVWSSSDAGASWQLTRLSNGLVWTLAVDSTGTLYAGTNGAGAQISRDRGATWTILPSGIEAGNKPGYGIWIDPNNGQKMFVSSEDGYGMVWSQDSGLSWTVAGQGFTAFGSRGVAFDNSDSRRIYAGGMVGNVFLKSTDGGLTWSTRRFGTAAAYVIAVAIDALSPNTIYVGTQNEGVFKSTDYGDTWKSPASAPAGAITLLTPDPTKTGRLFASTSTAFFLSEDGGDTWTNVLNVPAWTLTIDPNTPSTVYATARTQGIFRSADGGHTWQAINNGLTSLTMGRSAAVVIHPTSPQTLYVGSRSGAFKSLDGGEHWFAVNTGLDELNVNGLAIDPKNPAVLYACGPNGVYKTVTGAEVQSAPAISAVVNGASYLAGPVSPDEIVLITGSGLGPEQLIVASRGSNGLYSSSQVSGTAAQFNGTAAPVIYVSGNSIAVRVPLLSIGTAQVTVTYEGRTSAPFPTQVTQNSPGVFTLDSSGKGQAVAINRDGSINEPDKPAAAGDLISVYGTGVLSGQLGVDVSVGGQATSLVSYSSSGGVTRFDLRIPPGTAAGRAVPVVAQIRQGTTVSSQAGVTIAVQAASQIATGNSIGWATAVTTDPSGNVYFISYNSVFKVDTKGLLTRVAGNLQPGYSGDGGPAIEAHLYTDDMMNETPAFGFPSGLAVDEKGNLYISDAGNARVRKVSPEGIITTVAGTGTRGQSGDGGPGTSAQIINPRGLALDADGNLYIADTNIVRKLSAGGTISTAAPYSAIGVAVDNSGSIYLVDYRSVRRVSPDGSVRTVAGGTGIIGDGGDGGPATSAAFIGPTTVALDRGGNLYIGDVSKVRKVSPDGIIRTVAGGGKNDPGDGGPATDARIDVQIISIDNSGNLYIAGYGRVRKVSADGIITTVAGNGN